MLDTPLILSVRGSFLSPKLNQLVTGEYYFRLIFILNLVLCLRRL
jgi:hypothetical protein